MCHHSIQLAVVAHTRGGAKSVDWEQVSYNMFIVLEKIYILAFTVALRVPTKVVSNCLWSSVCVFLYRFFNSIFFFSCCVKTLIRVSFIAALTINK